MISLRVEYIKLRERERVRERERARDRDREREREREKSKVQFHNNFDRKSKQLCVLTPACYEN